MKETFADVWNFEIRFSNEIRKTEKENFKSIDDEIFEVVGGWGSV